MWQLFLSGGPVMFPLLFCSIMVMAITIERLWFFVSQRGDMDEIRRIVFRLMEKNAPLEAIQYLQKLNQPVARMYQAALLHYGKTRTRSGGFAA